MNQTTQNHQMYMNAESLWPATGLRVGSPSQVLNQNPGSPSAVLASVAVVRLRKVVSRGGMIRSVGIPSGVQVEVREGATSKLQAF